MPLTRSALFLSLLTSSTAFAQSTTFIPFAQVGQSYSAFVGSNDPRVGREVVAAQIVLQLTVDPGSDAAEFFLDLLLPINPLSGSAVVALSGSELQWSGSGQFIYSELTPRFNGTFIARRYGAETFGVQGSLAEGSGVILTFATPPCPADFNNDGSVDFFDYLDFVQAFADEDPSADFNANNTIDFFDYLDFISAFDQGC
jgi:hypothetical protein